MAGDAPQKPPAAAAAAAPAAAGPATWGTQHFDRAPTREELEAAASRQAAARQPTEQPAAVPLEGHAQQQQQQQPARPHPPQPPSASSVAEAIKSIKASDFLHVYEVPCARQGFLTGIGGGATVGMLRYVLGASIPKASNWAVGAFVLGGIVSFEVCQAARRAERAKMRRVVEVYDRKQAEMRQREAEKARQAAAEAQRRQQEEAAAARRWYRFW